VIRGLARGARVQLTRDLRRDIKRGHPWVFADAVRLPSGLEPGEIVSVVRDDRVVASGYVDPSGPLAVRICTTHPRERVDLAWAAARLDRALALRGSLFGQTAHTDGYRLVNGEGDGLPGLVVDRYGDTLVIKPDGPIAEAFWDLDAVADALTARTGLLKIYARSRSRGGAEGLTLRGEVGPETPFVEHGVRFVVDVREGQKTGFFLDQREHRVRLGGLAKDRRVLNVFGYTGGFSVHAGLGGARHVTTVDIAAPAITAASRNWRENSLPEDRHEGVSADAFAYLERAGVNGGARWDLVVLDPPAFAPSRKALPQALAAYRRLVALGAAVVSPGGLLFIASCSAHVPREALLEAAEEGVSEARRRATVLALGGQPPDHPFPLACPELAYLKTALLALDG
jgi:23S rRNA (cytosine1962-C5)-methyltransferase